jgi:glycosyltransferase involved in cell wall biosynthesis
MKILLITHLLPYPPRGGCSLRNFNLLREASERHEIHLLTFYQKAHLDKQSDLQRNIDETRKYCEVLEVFEIPTDGRPFAWYSLLGLNLFSAKPYSAWKFRSRKMADAIRKYSTTNSYDLVEIGTIALAGYRKLVPDIPSLMVHHNIESELLLRRATTLGNPFARAYMAYQGRKLQRYEEIACEKFDFHTTVSDRDGELLRNMKPGVNVETVPNGVDTEYFMPGNEPVGGNSLVFVGGMGWYPNLDAMLYFTRDIWHLIEAEKPDISMKLIGKQPSREIAEFSSRNPRFNAVGFIDDVRPHISRAAVYVVPIRVGGGTRLKILDAMAMGKAIVSTTIGCEGIDVTDGKDIVIADTPEEIALSTIELLRDRNRREELGKNARETAVNLYSWKKIYPRLESVYQRLAGMRK